MSVACKNTERALDQEETPPALGRGRRIDRYRFEAHPALATDRSALMLSVASLLPSWRRRCPCLRIGQARSSWSVTGQWDVGWTLEAEGSDELRGRVQSELG